MLERLIPEPEPPRKILPSLVFQSRIDSIVSSTLRMKQAEHCGVSSKPTLNQTGELKAAFWLSRIEVSSVSKASASSLGGEVAALAPPVGDRPGDAADHLFDRALALGRCRAGRGSTSGRRCWSRSGTSSSGTRPRAARRPGSRDCRSPHRGSPTRSGRKDAPRQSKNAALSRGPGDRSWDVLVAVLDIELLLSQRLSGVTDAGSSIEPDGKVLKAANKGSSQMRVRPYMVTTPQYRHEVREYPAVMVDDLRRGAERMGERARASRARGDGRATRPRGDRRRDRRGQAEAARRLPRVGLLPLARLRRRPDHRSPRRRRRPWRWRSTRSASRPCSAPAPSTTGSTGPGPTCAAGCAGSITR